ncbi:hypothetical protein STEG23_014271 [Scotinomys teguina]
MQRQDRQETFLQQISNLVDYFCKQIVKEKDHSQETEIQAFPVAVREAATQLAQIVEVGDATTQQSPVEVHEAATQPAPMEDADAATQLAPVKNVNDTQLAPMEDADAATQLGLVVVHEEAKVGRIE